MIDVTEALVIVCTILSIVVWRQASILAREIQSIEASQSWNKAYNDYIVGKLFEQEQGIMPFPEQPTSDTNEDGNKSPN